MSNRKTVPPQPPKQLPPWALSLICVGLIGVSLVVFALFDHVIPVSEQDATYVPPTVDGAALADIESMTGDLASPTEIPTESAEQTDAVDATQSDAEEAQVDVEEEAQVEVVSKPAVGDFSDKFADKFTDGEVIVTDTSYQSANVNITLSKVKGDINGYEQVCFIEDIYIRNIDCLRTVMAKDKFGRSLTEEATSMSKRANAICAINSDFYSFGNAGIVIRNGMLYRDKYQSGEDVLVIYRDGSMRVFTKSSQVNTDQLMADGAWQAFSFGPSLLDENGELRAKYKSVNHDPRTLLGMIEPGHYLFIVVDGRQNGYSEGLTYYESALLAKQLGCTVAFNLDGGKTSQMLFGGKLVNRPYNGGRDTSDLICIADITW